MAEFEEYARMITQLQEANADANDCVFPSPNGNSC